MESIASPTGSCPDILASRELYFRHTMSSPCSNYERYGKTIELLHFAFPIDGSSLPYPREYVELCYITIFLLHELG